MEDPMEFAINLALQAGKLLQKYYNPAGIHAESKPDNTMVTEADLASDKLITGQITQNYPFDAILSEESHHSLKDPQTPTWVIDPLDGTTNFSLGLSIWGVSIARVVYGYPEFGVLFYPRMNELYVCRRGSGAHLNHNKIIVHSPDPSQPMSFFACCSRSLREFNIDIPYKTRILGSSTYTLAMVARGMALLGMEVTPKIWDLAAAWLLVEEAGGIMNVFEGPSPFPLSPDIDYSLVSFATLAAATQKLIDTGHQKIHRK